MEVKTIKTLAKKRVETKEIQIQKGEETNKLIIMRELLKDIGDNFETIKYKNNSQSFFMSNSSKVVSKFDFKVTLTIEYTEE